MGAWFSRNLFLELGLIDRQRLDASQFLQMHGQRYGVVKTSLRLVDMCITGVDEQAGVGILGKYLSVQMVSLPGVALLRCVASHDVEHNRKAKLDRHAYDVTVRGGARR